MAKRSIFISGQQEPKLFADLPNFDDRVRKVLVDELQKAGFKFERQVAIETPVGVSGQARGSVYSELVGAPMFGSDIESRVGMPVSYAYPLEVGQDKHWPPKGALRLWVQRVLGVPEEEVDSVEFLVRRSIAQGTTKGTALEGQHMFEKAWKSIEADVRAEIIGALKKATKENFNG